MAKTKFKQKLDKDLVDKVTKEMALPRVAKSAHMKATKRQTVLIARPVAG